MWDLEYLKQIEPVEFENVVAGLFRGMGYKTQLTPVSGDGGVDIEVSIEHVGLCHRWLVQAKRYTANVGVKEVREYCSLRYREQADGVIIVTTAGFTRGAYEEAAKHNVKLIEGALLISMLEHYCPDSLPSPKAETAEEFRISGEEVIERQEVNLGSSRVSVAVTPKHMYFEKPGGSIFSRKPELIRRLQVKDIAGFHEEGNRIFMVLGGSRPEIVVFSPVNPLAFRLMLEKLRFAYLRGETLVRLEKTNAGFVVLTSRRLLVIGKGGEVSLSLELGRIAGCETDGGFLRQDILVILEAGETIRRHRVEVRNASGWAGAVREALKGR
jgi:restriction system protein